MSVRVSVRAEDSEGRCVHGIQQALSTGYHVCRYRAGARRKDGRKYCRSWRIDEDDVENPLRDDRIDVL